jgi:hypothetical protein
MKKISTKDPKDVFYSYEDIEVGDVLNCAEWHSWKVVRKDRCDHRGVLIELRNSTGQIVRLYTMPRKSVYQIVRKKWWWLQSSVITDPNCFMHS